MIKIAINGFLNEPKRDTVLVAVILGTFSLLLVMMPKRGLMTILSVVVNPGFIITLHFNAATGGRWVIAADVWTRCSFNWSGHYCWY